MQRDQTYMRLYLRAKRGETDAEIEHVYQGCADEMLDEVAELVELQHWPDE